MSSPDSPTHKLTLPRAEILRLRNEIQALYTQGHSFFQRGLKLFFQIRPLPEGAQPVLVAFSVPKRNFKRAVHRNIIKRRMREVYRLNKTLLTTAATARPELQILMGWVCLDRQLPTYPELEKRMLKLMVRMQEAVQLHPQLPEGTAAPGEYQRKKK